MLLQSLLTFALQAAAPEATPEIRIVRAEFLSELVKPNGMAEIVATNRIPYRPGTSCYRWVIHVEPQQRRISVKEVFKLPASAISWGGVDGVDSSPTQVNEDRTDAITEIDEWIGDGMISHGWCVAAGDPEGVHDIKVFAGDRLLHTFVFSVESETY